MQSYKECFEWCQQNGAIINYFNPLSSGRSLEEIAKDLGVHEQQVRSWYYGNEMAPVKIIEKMSAWPKEAK